MSEGPQTCRACGRKFVFALSRNDKPGPILLDPAENGNALLYRRDGELRYAVANQEVKDWAKEQGVPLRLNHFADCPEASRFRPAADVT